MIIEIRGSAKEHRYYIRYWHKNGYLMHDNIQLVVIEPTREKYWREV
jgi:hypothetical protein